MSRNLINFSDLTKKDIFDLIELANNFKSEDALDYRNENLFPDKKIVSMFCEPSTRTKLSFEIAAHNLGAKFIDFDLSNSSMNKGETLEDTLDAMQMMGVDLCILRHTESVIHDDIIDNETLRRQKDPFHIKYGYNTSVLTGDFVLGLILNIASRINNPRVTKNLATTAMMMSEGEVLEGRLETSEDVTFDDYLKVIEYKTATAFETASRLGAIISGGTDVEIESLADYGKNIGIAYQIRDDLHDWKNEDKLFNLLIKNSSDPRDVFNDMEELFKKYSDRAIYSIRKIKDSQAKDNLENLVRFTRTTA